MHGFTKDKYAFVRACILGDGSLTWREKKNTTMMSFTHCQVQKEWLEYKATRLNAIFGKNCKVGCREQYDDRTHKTYQTCQFSITSKSLTPIWEIAYPGNVKTFSTELLKDLTAEHLAVFWADDGNLEPKARVGRLNVYKAESECRVVADWIYSVCGAEGRYEDYEKNGFGRLRFPATEMLKIAIAIRPYLLPMFHYKVDMQYRRNTTRGLKLSASSPTTVYPDVKDVPEADALPHKQWQLMLKSLGLPDSRNGTKVYLRSRVISFLESVKDNKPPRAQG